MFRMTEQAILCTIQGLIAIFFVFCGWLEPHNLGLALFAAVFVPFLFTWLYAKSKDSILWTARKLASASGFKRRS